MSTRSALRLWPDTIHPSGAAFLVAIVFPTLIAFNLAPSSTFFNQAAAFVGWGMVAMVVAFQIDPRRWLGRETWLLLAPIALLIAEAAASTWLADLPSTLGLASIGAMCAALIIVLLGAAVGASTKVEVVFRGFAWALVVAGLAGNILGCVQVFAPRWTDGVWIASVAVDGRAAGNLRQPNHLSSLLVWALVAQVWLWQAGSKFPRYAHYGLAFFAVVGIVLTGSRTGLVDVLILAVWGACDRRLPRAARLALLLAPAFYAIAWWGFREWAHLTGNVFGGEARMGTQGDISSSRYAIWSDTIALIAQHPIFGVGFGEFNFAWSLTPFPHRPVAFFDHTHNIALQFAVELGIPMALLILGLLLVALFKGFESSWRAESAQRAAIARTASMLVLLIGIHSLFEYPLWYAYFLLPCAFAFGVALSVRRDPQAQIAEVSSVGRNKVMLAVTGAALLVGGILAVVDYMRVVPIFESGGGTSLSERIASGRKSVLFGFQADYAAATTSDHPSQAFASFKTATHNLLDTRLMIAWANAYAERRDFERARHIAQRLREFRNQDADEFFAPCASPELGASRFQCQQPTKSMDYRDFR